MAERKATNRSSRSGSDSAGLTPVQPSAARLDNAKALIDWGAAMHCANQRKDARAPLAAGMNLAQECGAIVLAERAGDEFAATGARARRIMLSGVASLTASERRVAGMAAGGMSNREIAQALFITIKTVQKHLGNTYVKLNVTSRERLPDALATDSPRVSPLAWRFGDE